MENEIQRIESIMKPLFDKQDEIKKTKEGDAEDKLKLISEEREKISNDNLVARNSLKLRLNRLRENKEREIAEYLQNITLNKEDFYDGYKDMIRKDLEQVYAAEEKKLEDELEQLEKELVVKLEELDKQQSELTSNKVDYSNVYAREIFDLKNSLRPTLFSEKKDLIYKIKEQSIAFDTIMLKLSNFKYEYDDQHRVTNSNAWRELYDQSNKISERKMELEKALKLIDDSIALTEFTESVRPLTSWEQAEYDRRKDLTNNGQVEEIESKKVYEPILPEALTLINPDGEDIVVTSATKDKEDAVNDDISNDTSIFYPDVPEDIYSGRIDDVEKTVLDDPISVRDISDESKVTEEKTRDIIKLIYNDILEATNNMRFVKLNASKGLLNENERYISTKLPKDMDYKIAGKVELSEDLIQLPNGQLINKGDLDVALDNYGKKSKGKTFVVKEINKKIAVTPQIINKLKNSLKECSAVKLIREAKLGHLDAKRAFGEEKTAELQQQAKLNIAGVDEKVAEGEYISREDFLTSIASVVNEKAPSWVSRIRDYFKNKKEASLEYKEGFVLDLMNPNGEKEDVIVPKPNRR